MTQDITTAGPSRRTITKGAAWAVPAVSVAAAAPALAASTSDCSDPASWQDGLTLSQGCLVNVIGVTASSGFQICNDSTDGCVIPAGTQFIERIYSYTSDHITGAVGARGAVELYDTYLSVVGVLGGLFEDFSRPLIWSSISTDNINGQRARSSSRTITLNRPVAAGSCTGYGYLLNSNIIGKVQHRFEHVASGKQAQLNQSGLINQCN